MDELDRWCLTPLVVADGTKDSLDHILGNAERIQMNGQAELDAHGQVVGTSGFSSRAIPLELRLQFKEATVWIGCTMVLTSDFFVETCAL